ncbi:unnamed protein product, partial [Symbiodinium natans]
YFPSGFTVTCLPHQGCDSLKCVNTSTAQTFQNERRNRDMVYSHVQGLQMNAENWCGCQMHPAKMAMVPPPVSSALMAR